jgi:flavin-dependent dehydrogenase
MLEAKISVPQGSNALQILRDTVVIKYRTYPDLGAFVTSLCGIDAPKGMVWTFTVDDKWSTVGIGSLTLERDTVIEWTTR